MKKIRKVSINQKGNKTTLNCLRLVAFGDSMTAGAEILDHLHPLGKLKKKWGMKKWSEAVSADIEYYSRSYELQQQSKAYSWPNQLANMLQIKVENFAVGGNSLERVCYDILSKHDDLCSDDLILVGLPPQGRYIWFRPEGMNNIVPGFMTLTDWWQDSGLDLKTMSEFHSDDKFIWDYISQIMILDYLKKSQYPYLFVIPQWDKFNNLQSFDISENCRKLFTSLLKKFNDSDIFLAPSSWYCKSSTTRFTSLEFGHPDKGTHRRIALYLNKVIYKE